MDLDSLKAFKKITEKNLEELLQKKDATAAETKAAKDAFELLDYLDCKIEDCKMESQEKEYSQYSGHDMDRKPYREYQITSYRGPVKRMSYSGPYHGRSYNSMSHDMRMMDGRNNWYSSDPYADGYSSHSIGDRVVSLVEGMFDDAQSDYERSQLRKFIEMIRAAG